MHSILSLSPRGAVRCGLFLFWLTAAAAWVHAVGPSELPAVARLLNTLEPQPVTSRSHIASPAEPSLTLRADGTVRHLAAPAGRHFRSPSVLPGEGGVNARRFLDEHTSAFGLAPGSSAELVVAKLRSSGGRNYVTLNQTHAGLPVFGAQAVVQLDALGGVEYVANYMARGLTAQTPGAPLVVPGLSAEEAAAKARGIAATEAGGLEVLAGSPRLTWLAPELVGLAGPLRLAWDVPVFTVDRLGLHCRMFLDATTGERLFQYSRACSLLARTIFDAENNPAWPPSFPPPVPRRVEGGPSSSVQDVNNAYDGIGDAYGFYLSHHGRLGLSGTDLPIFAAVRVCLGGQPCPWPNAGWSGSVDGLVSQIPGFSINEGVLGFGDGWTTDDIVAHEYTHAVTEFESGLIYANASGAINESFSDIWGEFVDQNNGRGNDQTWAKWSIGEDLGIGVIRSMSDPTARGDPDRLGNGNFIGPSSNPNISDDWGGVHSNSGVINKLCYLLTDGQTFRGYTISAMGMDRVLGLFYEVNAHLLAGTADYTDLAAALRQAASNLGWNSGEIANLHQACLAVEILPNFVGANTGTSPNGCRRSGVSAGGPWPSVAQGVAVVPVGDPVFVLAGSYNERLTITKPVQLKAHNGAFTIGR